MKIYFPCIYDIKYIIRDISTLKYIGLAGLSIQIGVINSLFSAIG